MLGYLRVPDLKGLIRIKGNMRLSGNKDVLIDRIIAKAFPDEDPVPGAGCGD